MYIWKVDGSNWAIDQELSTHKCNETDKSLFYNFDTVKHNDIEKHCLRVALDIIK